MMWYGVECLAQCFVMFCRHIMHKRKHQHGSLPPGLGIPSLPSTHSVHDFHKFGIHPNSVAPGFHFHLAACINPETGLWWAALPLRAHSVSTIALDPLLLERFCEKLVGIRRGLRNEWILKQSCCRELDNCEQRPCQKSDRILDLCVAVIPGNL